MAVVVTILNIKLLMSVKATHCPHNKELGMKGYLCPIRRLKSLLHTKLVHSINNVKCSNVLKPIFDSLFLFA